MARVLKLFFCTEAARFLFFVYCTLFFNIDRPESKASLFEATGGGRVVRPNLDQQQ